MYEHTLNHRSKHFCCYCFQAFSTGEISKCHVNDGFNINGKQMIKTPKKVEHVTFRIYKSKIKSPFIYYADFESILVPEDKGKQNQDDSYTENIKIMLLAVMVKN